MTPRQFLMLTLLAAIWGGSFLFMRIAAPEFGPVPLIQVRITVAAVFLFAVLGFRKMELNLSRKEFLQLLFLGIINSALPFSLLAYATMHLSAGMGAVLNATAPFFAALVAWLWLKERLDRSRIAGLLIGFTGVVVLGEARGALHSRGNALAFGAALLATALYGYATNYHRKYLVHLHPLVVATVSQVGGTLFLIPISWGRFPVTAPSTTAWGCAFALGILCTGIAYLIFFRLVQTVGAAKAIAVTFLLPVFGILWGSLILTERFTLPMAVGAAIILFGTTLATGFFRPRFLVRAPRKLT